MYYLILTMILWRQDPASNVSSSMQTIEFRDEVACKKAAVTWKTEVRVVRRPSGEAGPMPNYSLSAVCVPSDSTSRIK